jgi:hypothetical protein
MKCITFVTCLKSKLATPPRNISDTPERVKYFLEKLIIPYRGDIYNDSLTLSHMNNLKHIFFSIKLPGK